jgi:hypothetical protein
MEFDEDKHGLLCEVQVVRGEVGAGKVADNICC